MTGSKINLAALGKVPNAKHADVADSANVASSASTANTASSAQPVAFARVLSSSGGLDTANSKNVGFATWDATDSAFCLGGIPFPPKGGQAIVNLKDTGGVGTAMFALGTDPHCPGGTQAVVQEYAGATPVSPGFFVHIYG